MNRIAIAIFITLALILSGCATSGSQDSPVRYRINSVEGCGSIDQAILFGSGDNALAVPAPVAFCSYSAANPEDPNKLMACFVIEESPAGQGLIGGTPSKEACEAAGFSPFRFGLPAIIPTSATPRLAPADPAAADLELGETMGAGDSTGDSGPAEGTVVEPAE